MPLKSSRGGGYLVEIVPSKHPYLPVTHQHLEICCSAFHQLLLAACTAHAQHMHSTCGVQGRSLGTTLPGPGPMGQHASTSNHMQPHPHIESQLKFLLAESSLTFAMRWALGIVFVSLQLGLSTCDAPSRPKRYAVNLDLEPQERWKEVAQDFTSELSALLKAVKKLVPPAVIDIVSIIEADVERYLPYPYNLEIVGIAASSKVTVGEVVLGNTIYELTAFGRSGRGSLACTSIVAEALNGTIYHGRNLDYELTNVLRNLTIVVDFQQSGKTAYTGTTFAGYVGLLSGQKPHGFTVTLDERDQGDWWMNAFEALLAGTHGIAGFLVRDTIANPSMDFESAVDILAYTPLIAPCYLIIGGVGPTEAAVITRDRIASLDIWRLNPIDGRWFLVATNYDHWTSPPSGDDRRDPAIRGMNKTGRADLGVGSLFSVLSTPPVLNNATTYTVIMSAAIPDLYSTWIRHPN